MIESGCFRKPSPESQHEAGLCERGSQGSLGHITEKVIRCHNHFKLQFLHIPNAYNNRNTSEMACEKLLIITLKNRAPAVLSSIA